MLSTHANQSGFDVSVKFQTVKGLEEDNCSVMIDATYEPRSQPEAGA